MKYRKLPVEIEAVRYGAREYADNPLVFEEVPEWLKDASDRGDIIPVWTGNSDYWSLDIKTLEGFVRCDADDYIIRGVKGELYPCKPDIFKLTYEAL